MNRSDRPRLHLVTDPRYPRAALLRAIEAAAGAGVDLVQVRDRQASAGELFDLAGAIVRICRPRGVSVAVNDRLDVALAVGADAVQLGSQGLPVAVVRKIADRLQQASVPPRWEAAPPQHSPWTGREPGLPSSAAGEPGRSPRGGKPDLPPVHAADQRRYPVSGVGMTSLPASRRRGERSGTPSTGAFIQAPLPAPKVPPGEGEGFPEQPDALAPTPVSPVYGQSEGNGPPVTPTFAVLPLRIGASVHDVEAAREAADGGADWLTFGHVFPSASHPGEPPRGVEQLAQVVTAVQIPVIAIGGLDVANLRLALDAGAAGIAVISAILSATDPASVTAALRQALDRGVLGSEGV